MVNPRLLLLLLFFVLSLLLVRHFCLLLLVLSGLLLLLVLSGLLLLLLVLSGFLLLLLVLSGFLLLLVLSGFLFLLALSGFLFLLEYFHLYKINFLIDYSNLLLKSFYPSLIKDFAKLLSGSAIFSVQIHSSFSFTISFGGSSISLITMTTLLFSSI